MNKKELLVDLRKRLLKVEWKLDAVIEFFGIEKERNPFNVGGWKIINGKLKEMTDETEDDCWVKIESLLDRFGNDEKARIFLNYMCMEYWRKKFTKK